MVQKNIKKWQKSIIICRGLIYQAQFFEPKGGGGRGIAVCGGWGSHEAKPCKIFYRCLPL